MSPNLVCFISFVSLTCRRREENDAEKANVSMHYSGGQIGCCNMHAGRTCRINIKYFLPGEEHISASRRRAFLLLRTKKRRRVTTATDESNSNSHRTHTRPSSPEITAKRPENLSTARANQIH